MLSVDKCATVVARCLIKAAWCHVQFCSVKAVTAHYFNILKAYNCTGLVDVLIMDKHVIILVEAKKAYNVTSIFNH